MANLDRLTRTSPLERAPAGALARWGPPLGSVYLLLDLSASMADGGKLEQVRRGTRRFALEAWQRQYAVGVITFSWSASCFLSARRFHPRLEERLRELSPHGGTKMARALSLGMRKLRWCRGDKVLFLITDGLPDDREATVQAAHLAQAKGITLVAIGTDGADWDFLASLTLRDALATRVAAGGLEEGIVKVAGALPGDDS